VIQTPLEPGCVTVKALGLLFVLIFPPLSFFRFLLCFTLQPITPLSLSLKQHTMASAANWEYPEHQQFER
jgi:hypothetical protein